jgi:hypothetical protein
VGSQQLVKRAVNILEERWCSSRSVEGQKTCANDKHKPCCNNNEHRKERQKNRPGIKKPYAVFQHYKFMKGKERADQYLSYYVDQMVKGVCKTVHSSMHFCVQNSEYTQTDEV